MFTNGANQIRANGIDLTRCEGLRRHRQRKLARQLRSVYETRSVTVASIAAHDRYELLVCRPIEKGVASVNDAVTRLLDSPRALLVRHLSDLSATRHYLLALQVD